MGGAGEAGVAVAFVKAADVVGCLSDLVGPCQTMSSIRSGCGRDKTHKTHKNWRNLILSNLETDKLIPNPRQNTPTATK